MVVISVVTPIVLYLELVCGLVANLAAIAFILHHLLRHRGQTLIAFILLAMACCYVVSLVSNLGHRIPGNLRNDVSCKLAVFFVHTASVASNGFWLVLSVFRFIAVYRPFWYKFIRLRIAVVIGSVVAVSTVAESWVLVTVGARTHSDNSTKCGEHDVFTTQRTLADILKVIHLLDLCLSYVVPVTVILVLDSFVICFPRRSQFSDSRPSRPSIQTTNDSQPRNRRLFGSTASQRKASSDVSRMLKTYFLLASVHLVLTVPFYTIMAFNILEYQWAADYRLQGRLQKYSYMLYQLQYTFIVPYMWLLIYKRRQQSSGRSSAVKYAACKQWEATVRRKAVSTGGGPISSPPQLICYDRSSSVVV